MTSLDLFFKFFLKGIRVLHLFDIFGKAFLIPGLGRFLLWGFEKCDALFVDVFGLNVIFNGLRYISIFFLHDLFDILNNIRLSPSHKLIGLEI